MKKAISILMKYIYQLFTLLSTLFFKNFSKSITLFSLIVGIYGAILSVSDDLSYFRNKRNQTAPWSAINEALKNLNEFDLPIAEGEKISLIDENENGYTELLKIISNNLSDINMNNVTGVFAQRRGMEQIIARKFVINTIFFGVIRDNSNTEFIENLDVLKNWINNYRKQFYIVKGLRFILLSFVLQFISLLLPKRLILRKMNK